MGVLLTEGWGGRRIWKGSAWAELYYGLYAELSGDANFSMTSTGKFPNNIGSVFARLKINVVFDTNTLDNSNTFEVAEGSSWPLTRGPVSIPTVKERNLYDRNITVGLSFGERRAVRVVSTLSGIERVPGTTGFDRVFELPARAWATPNAPTVPSYTVDANGVDILASISGNQLDPKADRYWDGLSHQIKRPDGSVSGPIPGMGSDKTRKITGLELNKRYEVQFRSWNEDGGASPWSAPLVVYTKPAAPTMLDAKRIVATPTSVQLRWSHNTPNDGKCVVERRMAPTDAWAQVGESPTRATSFVDQNVPTGVTPQYRVRVRTPDGLAVSDYSGVVAADVGSIKEFIPGIGSIAVGSDKVKKVMLGTTQIWYDP